MWRICRIIKTVLLTITMDGLLAVIWNKPFLWVTRNGFNSSICLNTFYGWWSSPDKVTLRFGWKTNRMGSEMAFGLDLKWLLGRLRCFACAILSPVLVRTCHALAALFTTPTPPPNYIRCSELTAYQKPVWPVQAQNLFRAFVFIGAFSTTDFHGKAHDPNPLASKALKGKLVSFSPAFKWNMSMRDYANHPSPIFVTGHIAACISLSTSVLFSHGRLTNEGHQRFRKISRVPRNSTCDTQQLLLAPGEAAKASGCPFWHLEGFLPFFFCLQQKWEPAGSLRSPLIIRHLREKAWETMTSLFLRHKAPLSRAFTISFWRAEWGLRSLSPKQGAAENNVRPWDSVWSTVAKGIRIALKKKRRRTGSVLGGLVS